jgi:hypothetical protein
MNCKNELQARRQRIKKLENKKKEGTQKLEDKMKRKKEKSTIKKKNNRKLTDTNEEYHDMKQNYWID